MQLSTENGLYTSKAGYAPKDSNLFPIPYSLQRGVGLSALCSAENSKFVFVHNAGAR